MGLFTQPDTIVQLSIGSDKTIESLGENAKAWSEGKRDSQVYPDPQLLNRYSYTANNPLKYNDPSGHIIPLLVVGVGALAGAAIGGFTTYLQGGSTEEVLISAGKGAVAGGVGAVAVLAAPALVGAAGLGGSALATGAAGGTLSGLFSKLTLNAFDVVGGAPGSQLFLRGARVRNSRWLSGGAGSALAGANVANIAGKPWVRVSGLDEMLYGTPRPTPAQMQRVQTAAIEGAEGLLVAMAKQYASQQEPYSAPPISTQPGEEYLCAPE